MALAISEGNGQTLIRNSGGTSASAPFWAALIALANQYADHDLTVKSLTFLGVPGQVGSGLGKAGGSGMALRPLQLVWPGGCCHRRRWCADL
jgi:hypothetical protein